MLSIIGPSLQAALAAMEAAETAETQAQAEPVALPLAAYPEP